MFFLHKHNSSYIFLKTKENDDASRYVSRTFGLYAKKIKDRNKMVYGPDHKMKGWDLWNVRRILEKTRYLRKCRYPFLKRRRQKRSKYFTWTFLHGSAIIITLSLSAFIIIGVVILCWWSIYHFYAKKKKLIRSKFLLDFALLEYSTQCALVKNIDFFLSSSTLHHTSHF